jgi:hypothetical protein
MTVGQGKPKLQLFGGKCIYEILTGKSLQTYPITQSVFLDFEMLVEFGDTMPIARKEGPRFENHDLLEKSRVDSYLQRFSGSIITL